MNALNSITFTWGEVSPNFIDAACRMLRLSVSQLSFQWQEMKLERIQEVAIELGNQLDLGLVF
jgi:hypothetical protein